MNKLYGLDLFVEGGSRAKLIDAFQHVTPRIPHLFFENEDFDRYLRLLGEEGLAVAWLLDPEHELTWKVDVELTQPIPSENWIFLYKNHLSLWPGPRTKLPSTPIISST